MTSTTEDHRVARPAADAGGAGAIRTKWVDASHVARAWSHAPFGGEHDLFTLRPDDPSVTDASLPVSLEGRSASKPNALLAKASKSFSRRLVDVAVNVARLPAPPPESSSPRKGEATSRLTASGRNININTNSNSAAVLTAVSNYLAYVVEQSESVFQSHVWQQMPHDAPLPSSSTSGVVEAAEPSKPVPSSSSAKANLLSEAPQPQQPPIAGGSSVPHKLGCLVPPMVVEQAVQSTESARLGRSAFPGGFAHLSSSHGIEQSMFASVAEHLRVAASNAVRRSAGYLLKRLATAAHDDNTLSHVDRSNGIVVTLWRSRKAGKLYQRSIASLNHAIRCCLLPSAFQGLLAVAVALDGCLFTVTWLPPILGIVAEHQEGSDVRAPPLPTAPEEGTEPAMMDAILSVLSVFLLRVDRPVGCIKAFATADVKVLLVPDADLLATLQTRRTSLHFASMLFTHCLPDHNTPTKRLLLTLRKFVLSRDMDVRKFMDRRTLLRDVCHAAGAHMRSLLEVRAMLMAELSPENVSTMISSEESREATIANVQMIANLILTECVARTLKSMIVSRSSSSGSSVSSDKALDVLESVNVTPLDSSVALPTSDVASSPTQTVCDVATEVLRRFATSDKFFKQSLLPAIAKKFPVGHQTPEGILIDKSSVRIPDVVMFLQHRLGIVFDSKTKSFTTQSQLYEALHAGGDSSAAQTLWRSAYGSEATLDATLPGIQSVSLRGPPGQLTMGSADVYAESLANLLRQRDTMHPAAASCGVLVAAYFALTAVELKLPAAWATCASTLDVRVMRHRDTHPFCVTTVAVMHQYVLQWIQAHTRLTSRGGGGGSASATPMPPSTPMGQGSGGAPFLELSARHSNDAAFTYRDDVLSQGTSGAGTSNGLGEFRPCTANEEAQFARSLSQTRDVDCVWTLHIASIGGLPLMRRCLQTINSGVSNSAQSKIDIEKNAQTAESRSTQLVVSWARAIVASRVTVSGNDAQWCAVLSSNSVVDFLQAFQLWVAIQQSTQTLHGHADDAVTHGVSNRDEVLSSALAIATALTAPPRRIQRGMSMADLGHSTSAAAGDQNAFGSASTLSISIPREKGGPSVEMFHIAVNAAVLCVTTSATARTPALVRDALVDMALRLPLDDPRGWLLLLLVVCPLARLPWMRPCCVGILQQKWIDTIRRSGTASSRLPALTANSSATVCAMARDVLSKSVALLHLVPTTKEVQKSGNNTTTTSPQNDKRSGLLWATADVDAILDRLQRCRAEGARLNGLAACEHVAGDNAELLFEEEQEHLRCLTCFRARSPVRIRRPHPSYDWSTFGKGHATSLIVSPPSGAKKKSLRAPHADEKHHAEAKHAIIPNKQSHYHHKKPATTDGDASNGWIVLNPLLTIKRIQGGDVVKAEDLDREKITELEAAEAFHVLMDLTLAARAVLPSKQSTIEQSPLRATRRYIRGASVVDTSTNNQATERLSLLVKALVDDERARRDRIEEEEGCDMLNIRGHYVVSKQSLPDATHRRRMEIVVDGEVDSRLRIVYAEAEEFALDLEAPHRAIVRRALNVASSSSSGIEDVSWLRRSTRRSTVGGKAPLLSPLDEGLTPSDKSQEDVLATPPAAALRAGLCKRLVQEEMEARRGLYENCDFEFEYMSMCCVFDGMEL